MSDEADAAQEKMEIGLTDSIRIASTPGPALLPNGRCHWCDDLVADEHRWCGVHCRDEWQKAKKGRK